MEFGLVHILLGLVSFLLFLDGCRSQKKAFRKDQSDKKPNIIFILTDDQDVTMNGITPMKQTQKLIGDAGMTFTNMFASTPICCPSRSSILTGNYIHNHNAVNNTIQGHCSSTEWQNGPEKNTFAAHLKAENYTTFFAGKYLNQYGNKHSGGHEHIPPGWDWWTALLFNSVYYNYSLSVNGTLETHGDDYQKDYLTDIINNKSVEFLEMQHEDSVPFFMMISTPACHSPYEAAPQYANNFTKQKLPKDPSYNTHAKDKHWILRQAPTPMSNASLQFTSDVFKKRWRTLLSVDDIVVNVVNLLKAKSLLDSTYIIFSSDNGFHLGQFSLPNDKRQLYEFDIRVPLMIRGPGIKAKSVNHDPVVTIDIMPTIVHLTGATPPSNVDGTSLLPLLLPGQKTSTWREDFLVEYRGEYSPEGYAGCPHTEFLNTCYPNCVCEDGYNNTYTCIRKITEKENTMFCQFSDSENFQEFYNLTADPYQLSNIASKLQPGYLASLADRLITLSVCKGATCRKVLPRI
ncbi:N-acetylglucosamine-6-sulfatase-like [Apostichopus japonicus]|uniref:N-acetylglucosamine-6-sulfatase-like n=1 Tax=Stichopus japonicus TaxID=307972 RepID=UPI003AB5472E